MPSKWSADTYLFIREHFCTMHSQLYSVQHFYWRHMKISAVFSNVQNYFLDNLQHNLCVQCSELVKEVCEEKGHCHYYTVIWLFCESHPIYNGRPSTRKTKRQPRTRFSTFSDDFATFFHLLLLWVTPNIHKETINTRRNKRQPEIFHDFSDDFAIIFSSVSSLSHKGIHEDIIYYHSILFPINFFFFYDFHMFFVCFLSVSYRVFF